MRNILNVEEVLCKKDFFIWFIMNSFPVGVDEKNDMSIYDVIEENYTFDMDWYNKFTRYYDGVFDETDGYVDTPNAIFVPLNNGELIIEFHPGDIIFIMNNKKIGSTGADYNIGAITMDEYMDLTNNLPYETKLFLLPMVSIKECETAKFRNIIELIISNYKIKKNCKKQIVEIILNNCLL